jgi:2-aminoadipate transaminase
MTIQEPKMAISPPPLRAGAPLSRRLADTQSSPVRELLETAMQPHIISLAGGLPAPDTFDVPGLRAAFDEVLSGPDAVRSLQYSLTEGDLALRARLAAFMGKRGLQATGRDVLITTGSQQALGLVASALCDPGDTILVEDPTYLAALQTFQLADVDAVAIPGDEHGPDPEGLIQRARETGAKAAYLIPTFQNPTGRTLTAERRTVLAEAAATAGLWLIEDDPYSALRLDGEPVDLLAAHPAARERTIVIQTLSKVLSPGLRIGYLRAPGALRGPLAVAKQAADLHTSTIAQLAAERWLARNDLSEHIAGLAAHYRPRRDALLAALSEHLPEGSSMTRPEGGLFVWVTLPAGHDAEAILPRAIDRGVAFVPGKYFYAGKAAANTLRVSFATATPAELHEGAARLGAAIIA